MFVVLELCVFSFLFIFIFNNYNNFNSSRKRKMLLWLLFLFILLFIIIPFILMMFFSRLSNFEKHSFLFRLQYAVYTSPLGQYIHNYFLKSHKEKFPRPNHTILCNKLDSYETFSVAYIPFLEDNYAYFIIDHETGEVAVVDPADPITVIESLKILSNQLFNHKKLILTSILCTHKHMDHAGGNSYLKKYYPNIHIISGIHEKVSSQTIFLSHQDIFQLGSTSIQLLDTPCHTIGHVAFYIQSSNSISNSTNNCSVLFSGDTLFIGGCGRFFEGNGQIMISTLQTIKSLPLSTRIYCGHEYTVNNLSFCLLVEPENQILLNKYDWAIKQRKLYLPTIPSTLQEELDYNVFLRYEKANVISSVQKKLIENEENCLNNNHNNHNNNGNNNEKKSLNERSNNNKYKKEIYPEMNSIKTLEELRKWRNQEM